MTYPKWKSWESTEGPQLWIQNLYHCTRMRKWDECSESISGSGQCHLRVGSGPRSNRAGVVVIHLLLKLEWLWPAGYRRRGLGCAQLNVPAHKRPDNPGEHKWPAGRQGDLFCAHSFVHTGRISTSASWLPPWGPEEWGWVGISMKDFLTAVLNCLVVSDSLQTPGL